LKRLFTIKLAYFGQKFFFQTFDYYSKKYCFVNILQVCNNIILKISECQGIYQQNNGFFLAVISQSN